MRKNYVVREGDTLRSVSKYYYCRDYFWWFLALINFKWGNSQKLKEGEMIRVPNKYAIAFPISLIITICIWIVLIIRALR